ncbi:MAG: hypothetical protein RPU13_13505 [Candidatus Sedimenticola sp. (ex Thyasira tokunagai)]
MSMVNAIREEVGSIIDAAPTGLGTAQIAERCATTQHSSRVRHAAEYLASIGKAWFDPATARWFSQPRLINH